MRYDGLDYVSSEHAFQAQLVQPRNRGIFERKSVFSKYSSGFEDLYKKADVAAKKVSFWKRKKNIGILAKMISKRAWLEKRGIQKLRISEVECESIFEGILMAKYESNPELKKILLDTGDRYLLEFDRAAGRLEKEGKRSRWGGMIVDGKVVGRNQMGALMMKVRERFKTADAAKNEINV